MVAISLSDQLPATPGANDVLFSELERVGVSHGDLMISGCESVSRICPVLVDNSS